MSDYGYYEPGQQPFGPASQPPPPTGVLGSGDPTATGNFYEGGGGMIQGGPWWDTLINKTLNRPNPAFEMRQQIDDEAYRRSAGMDLALKFGMAEAGPQLMQNQIAREQLANQLAATGAYSDYNRRGLNEDYQFGLRDLGVRQDQLAAQREQLGRQPGFLQTLHDIAQRGFGLSRQNVTANADINRRGLDSALTARGAFTSVGGEQGRFDIASQLMRQMGGINLASEEETARFFENMAQIGDQNKQLDFAAKRLGIDKDRLSSELSRGLERLGLDTFTSVQDLQAKLKSSNLDDRILAQQIWNNALQSSDYYSTLVGPRPGESPEREHAGTPGRGGRVR